MNFAICVSCVFMVVCPMFVMGHDYLTMYTLMANDRYAESETTWHWPAGKTVNLVDAPNSHGPQKSCGKNAFNMLVITPIAITLMCSHCNNTRPDGKACENWWLHQLNICDKSYYYEDCELYLVLKTNTTSNDGKKEETRLTDRKGTWWFWDGYGDDHDYDRYTGNENERMFYNLLDTNNPRQSVLLFNKKMCDVNLKVEVWDDDTAPDPDDKLATINIPIKFNDNNSSSLTSVQTTAVVKPDGATPIDGDEGNKYKCMKIWYSVVLKIEAKTVNRHEILNTRCEVNFNCPIPEKGLERKIGYHIPYPIPVKRQLT